MAETILGFERFEPMKLRESTPFDGDDWMFELKFDGFRALAYLGCDETVLVSRRQNVYGTIFPELAELHRQVSAPCVLDGEIVALVGDRPDFSALMTRGLTSSPARIRLQAQKFPTQFVAFDILVLDGRPLFRQPLTERRRILEATVTENDRISISGAIRGKGRALFEIAEREGFEGVVAKRGDSFYYPGKRSEDWLKIKVWKERDAVVCGYLVDDEGAVKDLVLGAFDRSGILRSAGTIYLGTSRINRERVLDFALRNPSEPLFERVWKHEVRWMRPELVCIVKYMMKTSSGKLRAPVFKGFRDDKRPEDCLLDSD